MSDKIISLCYVSKRNVKSTELCRIADLIDGDFSPYIYSSDTDFYDTKRDLIYGSTVVLQAELESVGVFEWSAYLNASNEWRTETSRAQDVSWCEVIYTECTTKEQLVQTLKNGYPMTQFDRLHDIILCCCPVGYKCEAIYVSKSNIVYRDGKLCLLDSVITLPHNTLDIRYATGECKCRYSPYDTRKYLARKDACHVVGTVEIKTRDEVVGEIIKRCIGKDTLARKERQAARSALDKLSMQSVVETIAARFQCPSSQAQKYAEEYIVRARKKLESAESQRLIEMLIENDSDSVQRMRASVQKKWDETQQEQIKAAQQRQAEAVATLDSVRKQIANAEKVLQDMLTRQVEAENRIEKATALQRQIEEEINIRLEVFKTNYASALVENAVFESAMFPSRQSRLNTGTVSNQSKWKITLPENSTDIGLLEENLDVAIENWQEICVNQEMARGLTLLSFASYARKQPLLIVGEGAIPVTDMISSSICGQPAIKIYSTDTSLNYHDIIDEILKEPNAVVCLVNGLKNGYDQIRELMQMCPQRVFVITEMHAESLVMEPSSLFTVLFPVFCDYFYTGKDFGEFPTYDCSAELFAKIEQIPSRSVKDAKVVVSQWFNVGFYPPVVKERCARLFAAMNLLAQLIGISSNSVMAFAIEFLFAPMLKCMQKEDSLKSHLEECSILDSDRKATLISFMCLEE